MSFHLSLPNGEGLKVSETVPLTSWVQILLQFIHKSKGEEAVHLKLRLASGLNIGCNSFNVFFFKGRSREMRCCCTGSLGNRDHRVSPPAGSGIRKLPNLNNCLSQQESKVCESAVEDQGCGIQLQTPVANRFLSYCSSQRANHQELHLQASHRSGKRRRLLGKKCP